MDQWVRAPGQDAAPYRGSRSGDARTFPGGTAVICNGVAGRL